MGTHQRSHKRHHRQTYRFGVPVESGKQISGLIDRHSHPLLKHTLTKHIDRYLAVMLSVATYRNMIRIGIVVPVLTPTDLMISDLINKLHPASRWKQLLKQFNDALGRKSCQKVVRMRLQICGMCM